jgi:catalase
VIAPKVGGAVTSDGVLQVADQKLGGGPSVLYDAVVVLTAAPGATTLRDDAAAVQFVADAYAHSKFIGYVEAAVPLLAEAGVADRLDDGFVLLDGAGAVADFVERCGSLRFWEREGLVLQP